ncbi:MAG: PHP domain-containing protein [Moorea sp. SIO1F2]|uniref:PHP domain-containing protein n=1 Tax=Moorena sp. SIO1F2 TaxID=2607819 RepID=UPI0013BD5618|nr:PHP domain-containing protein [Moorena sp. SIO1F2]NET80897.1 PHP domain-containing protein [Moorena sp. SIO1F2]
MVVNIAQGSASPKIAAKNQQALRQVWETIEPDSCPYRYNFHMHTIYSDGRLKPEELIKQAINIGLKGFAITDHHSVSGYQVAQACIEKWQQEPSFCDSLPHFWTGVEITANLLDDDIHILGYAFEPEHPSLKRYFTGTAPTGDHAEAGAVIDAIHQAGGLAVLAHPARYRKSADELITAIANLGIDGVETYYAYTNPEPWQPSPKQTKQVKQLSATYNLFNTCGTDTHGLSLLKRI